MDQETAELIALEALNFLAENPEQLKRFMTLTGIGIEALRQNAGSSSTLAAVLDYLLCEESLLLVFCSRTGHDPATIVPAVNILAGAATHKSRDG